MMRSAEDIERIVEVEKERDWALGELHAIQLAHDSLFDEAMKIKQQRGQLEEALEACMTSLIDAGREHAPSVAKARAALKETSNE